MPTEDKNAPPPGPADATHIDARVSADKLKLLFHQSFPAVFVSALMAVLLCWALWPRADRSGLLLWVALLLASAVARLVVFVAYFRARPAGRRLLRWERPYVATLLLSSAIWGVGALLLMPANALVEQGFTMFALIGMAGGAVSTYSAYRYMAVGAMLAVLAPSTAWLAFQSDPLQIAMAIGSAVFMAASVRATKVFSTALHRSYQLTHELVDAQRSVEEHGKHFRFLAEKSGDAIWTLVPSTERVTYVSPAVRQLLGFDPGEMSGRALSALMTPDSLRSFRDELAAAQPAVGQRVGGGFRVEIDLIHRAGHVVHTEAVATLHFDAHGGLDSVIAVTHDISERKRDADSIRRLAFFDTLTELPNRRLLIDRLQQALAHARRDHSRVGVLCVDLDKFKPVNDGHGHQVGDWLLRAIAARLRESIRQSDTAARVGGDEFVVLLSDLALADDAGVAAEKIRAALERPFVTADGLRLSISASVGVALFPDHAGNVWDLLRVGDASMYRGKRGGGNAVVFAQDEEAASPAVVRTDERGLVRLEWKASYACGEASIDDEHRELFVAANRLIESAEARDQDFPAFLRAFDGLLLEVANHFRHEEAVLTGLGYQGVEAHALLHGRLLEQASLLRRRADARDVSVSELADFLVIEVVARHMLRADRAFAQELKLHRPGDPARTAEGRPGDPVDAALPGAGASGVA